MRTMAVFIMLGTMLFLFQSKASLNSFGELLQAGGAAVPAPPPEPAAQGAAAAALDGFPEGAAYLVKPAACHDPDAETFRLPASGEKTKIPYLAAAAAQAKAQGIDLRLLLAVIQQESSFDPEAKSPAGAVGLMQLLPETAAWLGLKDEAGLTVPEINIRYGAKYLKYLWGKFAEGSPANLSREDIGSPGAQIALAAYNAGPGNVKKYCGVPPFAETQSYVRKVTGYFIRYSDVIGAEAAKTEE